MVAIGSLALLSFWTSWLPRRGQWLVLLLLNLLLSFLIFADLVYFRYFQDLITVPVLTQAGQMGALGESIQSLLLPKDMFFFADLLLLIPLVVWGLFRTRKNTYRTQQSHRQRPSATRSRLLSGLAVAIIGAALVVVPIRHANKTWAAGLFNGGWWSVSLYNVTGVIGFHAYDLYSYADRYWLNNHELTTEQTEDVKIWFNERGSLRKQLESDPLFGAYRNSNVIALQLEAWQSFMIGKRIGGQPITPHIDKLLEDSVYFDRFYHQTAQGRTSDADLAANTSLQPVSSGSVFFRYAQNKFDSLPELLGTQGYMTSVFHAYDGGFWNRNNMYRSLQYGAYYNKKDYVMDEPFGWSLGDRSFFRQSVDIMKRDEPFYAFLISLSSHHPYSIPNKEQKLDLGELQGTLLGNYLQAVHYVDSAIGDMIAQLKSEGLWDQSIFLLYGDHDNSITDWEHYEQLLGRKLTEVDQLQLEKQVPFIVHLPRGEHAGTRHQVGGQLDIAPTILHLLGISSADSYMIGTPLITNNSSASSKQVVFRSGAFTNENVWFVPAADGNAAHDRCYNLESGALLDASTCQQGKVDARIELVMSDLLIEHNLIAKLRKTE